jgi:hypothetical protein
VQRERDLVGLQSQHSMMSMPSNPGAHSLMDKEGVCAQMADSALDVDKILSSSGQRGSFVWWEAYGRKLRVMLSHETSSGAPSTTWSCQVWSLVPFWGNNYLGCTSVRWIILDDPSLIMRKGSLDPFLKNNFLNFIWCSNQFFKQMLLSIIKSSIAK